MKKITFALLLVLFSLAASQALAQTYWYSWDTGIYKNCYSRYNSNGTLNASEGVDRYIPDYSPYSWPPRYRIGSTNETYNMGGGTMMDLDYNSPVWLHAWTQSQYGNYAIWWGVDKYYNNLYRDRYTFIGWEEAWDSSSGPRTLTDTYISFRMLLTETPLGSYSSASDGYGHEIGWSKLRAMVGVVAIWNNRPHYLEVNLWQTDNFDKVTTTWNFDASPPGQTWRDTSDGIYDRRFYAGSSGEGMYFVGSKLDKLPGMSTSDIQPTLTGSLQTYWLNISRLMRSTPWSDYPASWSNIRITGLYIGNEVWGGGRMAIGFDNYCVYGW